MEIIRLGSNQTIAFAAEELCRYLNLIQPELAAIVSTADCYCQDRKALWVGISPELEAFLPAVPDKQADDGIYIQVTDGVGIITGTNPRAVLIAVYRFLKELGAAWIRPGKDGEILPEKLPEHYSVHICEAASYRHRGICIEGAVSREHVLNMIDWIPKASMNGYFIQFQVPFIFFDRWYSHRDNPTLKPEPISQDEIMEIRAEMEEEIARRSLMYHTAGHGWTCEPFGVQGLGWDPVNEAPPESIRDKIALVNGKREYWGGVPLDTSLCYSNPIVLETMSNAVVEYCKNKPGMDYVHVWLADGMNNNCECDRCKDTLPSTYYIQLLNMIDDKLTREGITTKLVFLLYVDLLWVDQESKLNNPDRFVLMFAPITRSYTNQYVQPGEQNIAETTPYVRNKLVFPKKVEENLAYLRAWQNIFSGDSLDFDYHLMWDHLRDAGYYRCAEVLHADVTTLDQLGLNGYVSCQLQRAAFPTGLSLEMMAKGLWDKKSDFEEEAKAYFLAAFGSDGDAARLYLKTLSEQFQPPYVRGELGWISEQVANNVRQGKETIYAFIPVIAENMKKTSANVRRSWEYLQFHAELNLRYADVLIASAEGKEEQLGDLAEEVYAYVQSIEPEVQTVLDVYHYIDVLNKFLVRHTLY